MNKKKKTIYIIMIALIAILLSVGITFAAMSYERLGENSDLVVGDIYMYYHETNELSLENAMPSATYDSSKYFEFKIGGKNTYKKENIIYEIKLSHGDNHETRTERIRDDLLKFTLVEIKDGVETTVVDGASYDNLASQRLWISTIPMDTQSEIEITYRLYMWISDETTIGNGSEVDYDMATWDKVFASVKVNVTGDFNNKIMIGEDGLFEYALLSNGKIQLMELEQTLK